MITDGCECKTKKKSDDVARYTGTRNPERNNKKSKLTKNNNTLVKCVEETDDFLTDDQKYARETCSFIKSWQDQLQLKKESKRQKEPIRREPLEINLIKRALKDHEKYKHKIKTSPDDKNRLFLPAIVPFVKQRTRLTKTHEFVDAEKTRVILPQLVAKYESDSDRDASSDENLEHFPEIFPQLLSARDETPRDDLKGTGKIDKQVTTSPFSIKPKVVLFTDYELNKVYTKTVKLVNLHSSPLNCKVVGIEDSQLQDVIELDLIVSVRPIWTGMNCKLKVTFSPDSEIDIDTNILMETDLGLLSIPMQIRQKICCISIQPNVINFGTQNIGSTIVKTFQIINNGAKTTTFRVSKSNYEKRSSTDTLGSSPFISETPTLPSPSSKTLSSGTSSTPTVGTDSSNNEFMIDSTYQTTTTSDSKHPFLSYATPSSDVGIIDLDGIQLGTLRRGEILGKGKVSVDVCYRPQIAGVTDIALVVQTDDVRAKNLYVLVKAEATAPHVKVQQYSYNLKICAYDYLYQDTITLINGGNNKHKLTIAYPKSLKNHVDVLPQSGTIQPNSQFQLQLKFLPRETLSRDAPFYFDSATSVLEFPVTIYVSEQSFAINTTIHAVVSSTELQFQPDIIDFGSCYINECIQVDMSMINKGLLSQSFGFVNLSNCLAVQPNDGFGTILGNETVKLKIIFKPDAAIIYNSNFSCKTLYNRTFGIKWCGTGVEAPLKLSYPLVNFAATTLNNTTMTTIYLEQTVKNNKSIIYQFDIPDYCPVQIIPSSGYVTFQKPQKLSLIFKACLNEREIAFEALQKTLYNEKAESAPAVTLKSTKSGSSLKTAEITGKSSLKEKEEIENKKPSEDEVTPVKKLTFLEDVDKKSPEYKSAVDKLTAEFSDRVELFSVPCFFVTVSDQKNGEPITTTLRPLTLRLSCPFLKPKLKLISDKIIDFGLISVHQNSVLSISICNLTYDDLPLSTSVLNPHGVFAVVKKPNIIHSKCSQTLKVSFHPVDENNYYEVLEIFCPGDRVSVALRGRAIEPKIAINLEDEDCVNLNYALVGESSSSTFTITNQSPIALDYNFQFLDNAVECERGILMKDEPSYCKNLNGLNPFSLSPISSTLQPDQSQTVTVLFAPDNEISFAVKVKLLLFRKTVARILTLKGVGSKLPIFISGGDILNMVQNPLIASCVQAVKTKLLESDENNRYKKTPDQSSDTERAVYIAFDGPGCVKKILITFIHSTVNPVKKPVEFNFESVSQIEKLGFSLDTIKGNIEVGNSTSVSFTWAPSLEQQEIYFQNGEILTANVHLKLKTESTLLNFVIYLHGKLT